MPTFEYECAMTGVTEVGGVESDSDGLGDLPAGWTRVEMKRRQYNPKWVLIQQVKEAMVEALLQQFPENIRAVQQYAIGLQVEAQFYAMEKDTPMYVAETDIVYLSDSGEILESLNEIREMLGLEALEDEGDGSDEDFDEFDEDDDDDDDEGHLPHDGEVGDDAERPSA